MVEFFPEKKFLNRLFEKKRRAISESQIIFPEIFSKGCMNNRAPPLTLFNIFNGERGYIGWGT